MEKKQKQIKFAFVVLHYKNMEDTSECVDSILSLHDDRAQIVIVDNFSNDGTKEKLQKKYVHFTCVFCISSSYNSGFAKGNNLGIKYARALGCNFVCLLNNDTLIRQENFISICINEWKTDPYSICGPKIISTVDGLNQNPLMLPSHFVKTRKDAIRMYLVALLKYGFILFGSKGWWNQGADRTGFTDGLEDTRLNSLNRDFLLCGACLIFSPTFFQQYGKLCDWTFMYEEETILYFLSKRLHIKNMYFPQIEIYHKEQSSTRKSLGTGREKLLFGYREDLRSRGQLLKIVWHKNNLNFLANLIR